MSVSFSGSLYFVSFSFPDCSFHLSAFSLTRALFLSPFLSFGSLFSSLFLSYPCTFSFLFDTHAPTRSLSLFSRGFSRILIHSAFSSPHAPTRSLRFSLLFTVLTVSSSCNLPSLQALKFLNDRGIPYGHLHTGNVLVMNERLCQLSDIENGVLGACNIAFCFGGVIRRACPLIWSYCLFLCLIVSYWGIVSSCALLSLIVSYCLVMSLIMSFCIPSAYLA